MKNLSNLSKEQIVNYIKQVGPCISAVESEEINEGIKKSFYIIRQLFQIISPKYGGGSRWLKTNGKTSCVALHRDGDNIHAAGNIIGKFRTSKGRIVQFELIEGGGAPGPLCYFNDKDIYNKRWVSKSGVQDGKIYGWKDLEYERIPGTEDEYVDFSLEDCKILIKDLTEQLINKYNK